MTEDEKRRIDAIRNREIQGITPEIAGLVWSLEPKCEGSIRRALMVLEFDDGFRASVDMMRPDTFEALKALNEKKPGRN